MPLARSLTARGVRGARACREQAARAWSLTRGVHSFRPARHRLEERTKEMFNNLVESGSHRRDLARKGRFMLGTLALYGVLLAASGVASVLAYDARLERQTLELHSMVAP